MPKADIMQCNIELMDTVASPLRWKGLILDPSLAVRAQQRTMPLVGFLNAQAAAGYTNLVAAFKQGLNENGFVEGQNVTIEYRWADRHLDQLPELAAELVHLRPDVLVGTGGANTAAIAATKTIPVVVSFGGDPVKLGYVASLNHPGGNVTALTSKPSVWSL